MELAEGSPNYKRVFSPGFVVLCVFAAMFELIALNRFYGINGYLGYRERIMLAVEVALVAVGLGTKNPGFWIPGGVFMAVLKSFPAHPSRIHAAGIIEEGRKALWGHKNGGHHQQLFGR